MIKLLTYHYASYSNIQHKKNKKNNGSYKYVVVLHKIDGTCPVKTALDTKCLSLSSLDCKALKIA